MTADRLHSVLLPSPWVQRWAAQLPARAGVLDVGCGSGRHLRWLAALGHRVTGVDRDAGALAALRTQLPAAELVQADIEAGPWPFDGRVFDAVVVTNYLWRPLWPALLACVGPGGWWLHETFAIGNGSIGKPSNPDFLLRPGELLGVARGVLRVVGFEDGFDDGADGASPRFVQRIAAVRETRTEPPARHRLTAA